MAYTYTEEHVKEISNVFWKIVYKKKEKKLERLKIKTENKLKISISLKIFFGNTALNQGKVLFSAVCKLH